MEGHLSTRGSTSSSYGNVLVGGNAHAHFGDNIQNVNITFASALRPKPSITNNSNDSFVYRRAMGLCLDKAPYISSDLFIGRDSDLNAMKRISDLNKEPIEQRRIILGGMGGIGKTQLAIAYAKTYRDVYESIFWLNAMSEVTLKASFRSMAEQIFEVLGHQVMDSEQVLVQVKRWLSDTRNTRWLLIFDNYDEPESYKLETYYPYASHGTIIVTTRLPDQVSGHQLRLQPLEGIDHSLQILATRSERDNVINDIHARNLAERLAGLPLALATAGSYLQKSTWSFEQYLQVYEQQWHVSQRRPLRLQEYQDRTLYTTWNLSYQRLENEDQEAAQMLKALAYFDHQVIWFELLHSGIREGLPDWLLAVCQNAIEFESLMRVMVDYCFVEVQSTTQTYSMNTCVHDWTLATLNKTINPQLYWYAFDCVANLIEKEEGEEGIEFVTLQYEKNAGLTQHAIRLMHSKFKRVMEDISVPRLVGAEHIARLLKHQVQLELASSMMLQVFTRREKELGQNHLSTLRTANDLGLMYVDQDKLNEAELMYKRALAGFEKAVGPNHQFTLCTINNLGILYRNQGKPLKAEEMYTRALVVREKALGPDHLSTLHLVNNLSVLYMHQNRLDEAETMIQRALAGSEKALGHDHQLTLNRVHNLGVLYQLQGKLNEAELMLNRALVGCEKTLGPNHTSTLNTVSKLGLLHRSQGKLLEAEEMHARALAGYEKALGREHSTTLGAVHDFCLLYIDQGKVHEAEVMYNRILSTASGDQIEREWYDIVGEFAMFLMKSVGGANSKQSERTSLARLILLVDKQGRNSYGAIRCLTKALVMVKDDENAQFGLIQKIKLRNKTALDFSGITCDGCECNVKLVRGRHVCRVCEDVDLCDACMPKYNGNSLTLPGCSGHEFFDAGFVVSELLKSPDFKNQTNVEVWLNRLKEQYDAV